MTCAALTGALVLLASQGFHVVPGGVQRQQMAHSLRHVAFMTEPSPEPEGAADVAPSAAENDGGAPEPLWDSPLNPEGEGGLVKALGIFFVLATVLIFTRGG